MKIESPEMPVGPLPLTVHTVHGEPWTFERLANGTVRISGVVDSVCVESITLQPAQWASIVASVSWAGQTEERYRKAYRFHHGDEPAEGDAYHWSDGSPVEPAELAAQVEGGDDR